MQRLSNVLSEIHRRSVWQVLGVYAASGWGIIEAVDFVTAAAGLPDWTPTMALVLVLVGLPVVLATAVVQGGVKAQAQPWPTELEGDPNEVERASAVQGGVLNWRNAAVGGVGALILLAVLSLGYVLSWATGIGPMGNLLARGVIDPGDAILLADFQNSSDDEDLGQVVTEALRVDLGNARFISLLEAGQVESIMDRMQIAEELPISGDLALEVAVRGGVKALIEGRVGSAGTGYILTATIREVSNGSAVATFRRTAAGPAEVITAIDQLSRDIRERVGESLKSIRGEEPLQAVTTSSLSALRYYSEAQRLVEAGKQELAIERLRDAVEEDPSFAMAHRKLAVELANSGRSGAEMLESATTAYELRDRLTDRERWITEAFYHRVVDRDPVSRRLAYEAVLADYPNDQTALNNMASQHMEFRRWDEALVLLERATAGGEGTRGALYNLPLAYLGAGLEEEALAALTQARSRFPEVTPSSLVSQYTVYSTVGRLAEARNALERLVSLASLPEAASSQWRDDLALLSAAEGRLGAARTRLQSLLERARSDGRWGASTEYLLTWAAMEDLLGSGRAGELLESFAATELQRPEPITIDYAAVAQQFARAGLVDEARALAVEQEVLARGAPWESLARAATASVEALLAIDSDPDEAVDGIRRYRLQTDCPGCLGIDLARALAARGDHVNAEAELLRMRLVPDPLTPLRRGLLNRELARLAELRGDDRAAARYRQAFASAFPDADAELEAWLAETGSIDPVR